MGFWRLGVATVLLAAVFALVFASAQPVARRRGSRRSVRLAPARRSSSCCRCTPISADCARRRSPSPPPARPSTAPTSHLRELARRFGASAGTRRRVLAFLRRAGARHVRDRPDRAVRRRDAARAPGRPPVRDATCAVPRRSRRPLHRPAAEANASAASVRAARIPPALRGLVTGVVGLDTRPLRSMLPTPAIAPLPANRARGVATDLRSAADRNPERLRRRPRHRRVHAEPVPDRVRLRRPAGGRPLGPGPAGRADRGRWLQVLGP